jgi:DNA primase
VRECCPDLATAALVGELAVEPLLLDGEADLRYVGVTVARLQLSGVSRRVTEVKSKLQRMNPVTSRDQYLALMGELVSLEQHARALRDQAAGGL